MYLFVFLINTYFSQNFHSWVLLEYLTCHKYWRTKTLNNCNNWNRGAPGWQFCLWASLLDQRCIFFNSVTLCNMLSETASLMHTSVLINQLNTFVMIAKRSTTEVYICFWLSGHTCLILLHVSFSFLLLFSSLSCFFCVGKGIYSTERPLPYGFVGFAKTPSHANQIQTILKGNYLNK